MDNLAIICEGKTERNFADALLRPHFANYGLAVDTVEIGIDCLQHGGNVSFDRLLHDAKLLLNDYRYVTTLVDFFRLCKDWSGLAGCNPSMSSDEQARIVEDSALQDAQAKLCLPDLEARLFINVLMHEFEGLLFSDVSAIVNVTRAQQAKEQLQIIAASFSSPEDINTGRDTAPSKRLAACGANYGKIAHGTRIATEIGLERIREKCPHFNRWMTNIEQLGAAMG